MKLPPDVAAWLQRTLVQMSTDDMSALALASDRISDTLEHWQLVVDMIYRCLVSGVINAGSTDEWLQVIGLPDVKSFAEALAEVNPFDPSCDPGHWIDTFFLILIHVGIG